MKDVLRKLPREMYADLSVQLKQALLTLVGCDLITPEQFMEIDQRMVEEFLKVGVTEEDLRKELEKKIEKSESQQKFAEHYVEIAKCN